MGKNRVFIAISIIIIFLTGAIFFVPAKRVLQIQNRKNIKETYYVNAKNLEAFDISYTHSVNKGRVHDHYSIMNKKDLFLTSSSFVSYGAGMPELEETPGASFEIQGDTYILKNINRLLPKLTMAVGLIANHTISFYFYQKDKESQVLEYSLKDLFAPQTSITLEIKRVSLISYIKRNLK